MSGIPAVAVVVADGELPRREVLDAAWPGWSDGSLRVIAADGGARGAQALGLPPDVVVGDFDSLAEADLARLTTEGVRVERHPAAKDESDLELAIRVALADRPRRLVVLGAFGGRLDHALANLWLLADAALAELASHEAPEGDWPAVACLDGRTRVRLLAGPGRCDLVGPVGDLVTLLPFGEDALGVTTEALAYPLRDEPLRLGASRGLSNVRQTARAAVAVRVGRLLIIETHPQEGVMA